MKRNEILGEHKKGVKAVKHNKKPKDHSAEYGKAKEKLAPVKPMEGYNPNSVAAQHARELKAHHRKDLETKANNGDESAKRRLQSLNDKEEQMRNDYNDRMERESVAQEGRKYYGYDDSGMSLRPGNDEGPDSWDYSSAHDKIGAGDPRRPRRPEPAADVPHDVHINGRKWKTFGSKSHAENVARKLAANGKTVDVKASLTDEAMGAEVGKITKVDPTTKKATLTKADGSSMEVDSTALKPTPDGKMSMDTPDTDELKAGTAVVSTESMDAPPPTDSTSPIHGGQDNVDLRRLRELAGQPAAPAAGGEVDPGEHVLDVAATPEVKAFIEANTVRDTEGDVDLAGTFGQMLTKTSSEMNIKGLQDALVEMEVNIKAFPSTPEFQAMSPEDQANWKQNAPEWSKVAHELVAGFVKLQQTFAAGGKQATDLSQNPTPGQENPMKGVKSFSPPSVEEGTEDGKDLSNGFTLTTTEFEGKPVPAVFDSQDNAYWIQNNTGSRRYGIASYIQIKDGKANGMTPGPQTAAAMKAAGWKISEPKPRTEPAPDTSANEPFVPKDYETKEPLTKGPDGKWRNSKGEERDGLHGGPISASGGAMFRSLTPRLPTQESAELTAMLRIAGLR
jgi:hypothetical protein